MSRKSEQTENTIPEKLLHEWVSNADKSCLSLKDNSKWGICFSEVMGIQYNYWASHQETPQEPSWVKDVLREE